MPPDFESQEVKTTTQAQRLEREAAAQSPPETSGGKKEEEKEKAKAKAKSKVSRLRKNAGNPVYLANAVLIATLSAGLGYGAYQKHAQGKLSWELVGIVSGAVGAFALADYYVSKYVFSLRCSAFRFWDRGNISTSAMVQMVHSKQVPEGGLRFITDLIC